MNNKVKTEKYRKLSIAALVTGIMADGLAGLYLLFWLPITDFLRNSMGERAPSYIVGFFIPVVLGLSLSIATVVFGSIDLKRIKAGRYSNRGKGFDVAGIVLGGIFILFALVIVLGEIIAAYW